MDQRSFTSFISPVPLLFSGFPSASVTSFVRSPLPHVHSLRLSSVLLDEGFLEELAMDGHGVIEAKKLEGLSQTDLWMKEQDDLKQRLVLCDNFPWHLGATSSNEDKAVSFQNSGGPVDDGRLRYVGGVDLSFAKENSSFACGALVVMDLDIMQVVYEDFDIVQLTMPYVAGFLAFRETPVLLGLLRRMATKNPDLYPQLLMVDGNGILHPRGFGLASHLGVLADIPTIGIGKNLHHVDGLTNLEVRHIASASNLQAGGAMPLMGSTGQVWGVAFRSHDGCQKPVYVSVGHRISLETAVAVVRCCCVHRVPEPVRQADLRSREHLRTRPLPSSQQT